MATVLIELTNRCNLACKHCMDTNHRADGNLPMEIIEKIIHGAKKQGFDFLSFTGGEPTLHPEFENIMRMTAEAGYAFGFVTNAWNFTRVYDKILPLLDKFSGVTFSLDGASEETHDRVRRKGSFRKLMQAVSVCMLKDIHFTFNTIISKNNCDELCEITELAAQLGSQAHRFGQLIPTPLTAANQLDLLPYERKQAEDKILEFHKSFEMPVFIAPGYFTTRLFSSCAAMLNKEIAIDWRGHVCQCSCLSRREDDDEITETGVLCNLSEMSFSEAYQRLDTSLKTFREEKRNQFKRQSRQDEEHIPCLFCLQYYNKLDWTKGLDEKPWYGNVLADNILQKGNYG